MRLTRLLTNKEIELANDYSTKKETKRKKSDYTILENARPFDAVNKLGQLEDIEDELGIDLRVYHKLMDMLYCGEPNILYVKDKDMIIQVGVLEIDYCKKKIIFYKDRSYNDDYICLFIQYGKTWAFTKEELENGKKED